jgi:hypothetical protein
MKGGSVSLLFLRCWFELRCPALASRPRDEGGEGVISTAIAVLVMALIGLAMWQLFDTVFADAGDEIQRSVDDIGG